MEKLDIKEIRQLVQQAKIRWTSHVMLRLLQRRISQEAVKEAILAGEIIENYEDDYPYPSCLISGNSSDGALHVVCGSNGEELWIITAYHPDDSNWEPDLKTRKERE